MLIEHGHELSNLHLPCAITEQQDCAVPHALQRLRASGEHGPQLVFGRDFGAGLAPLATERRGQSARALGPASRDHRVIAVARKGWL